MMRLFILILSLFYTTLFGYEYDKLLLKAQSNIFPKLILLDKNLAEKVSNNEIVFCIVYHPSDEIKSENLKNNIINKFNKKLGKYHLKVTTKKFSEIKKDKNINAYYILQGDSKDIKKVCNIAKQMMVPTFSYDLLNFKDGVLISMTIQNNSTIYLNKALLKEYNIDFLDIFYQIVRFFDE